MIATEIVKTITENKNDPGYRELRSALQPLIFTRHSQRRLSKPTLEPEVKAITGRYYDQFRSKSNVISAAALPLIEALGYNTLAIFDIRRVAQANKVPASPARIIGNILLRDTELALNRTLGISGIAKFEEGDEYRIFGTTSLGDVSHNIASQVKALYQTQQGLEFSAGNIRFNENAPHPAGLESSQVTLSQRLNKLKVFSPETERLASILEEIDDPVEQARIVDQIERLSFDTRTEAAARELAISERVLPYQSYEQLFEYIIRQKEPIQLIRVEIRNVLRRINNDKSFDYSTGDLVASQELLQVLQVLGAKLDTFGIARRGLSYLIATKQHFSDQDSFEVSNHLSNLKTVSGNSNSITLPFIYELGTATIDPSIQTTRLKSGKFQVFDNAVAKAYDRAVARYTSKVKRYYLLSSNPLDWEHFAFEFNPTAEKGKQNLQTLLGNSIDVPYLASFFDSAGNILPEKRLQFIASIKNYLSL